MPPRKKQPPLTEQQAQASIIGTPGPAPREVTHLSYSGMSTYQECPKKYELSYMMGAPKKGAVWFVGGKAVHSATEAWDRLVFEGREPNIQNIWKAAFSDAIEESREKDPDQLDWRKAGVKKDNPDGESLSVWYSRLGPQLVQSYISWRRRTMSQFELWTLPDGQPAIEVDVSGSLPGMGGIEFKGFIDRVFYDKATEGLWVVDLKTGTRKPETDLQLGIYGAALTHHFDVHPMFGAAFMNRRGILADPFMLGRYTPEYVGHNFARLYSAIQAGYFNPVTGRHCGMCDVASSCYANSGPLAHRYDRDDPVNRVPF